MRLENEELHYRAKFDVYPYATQNPAFEKLCQILWDWVRNKERRSRSELFEALTGADGKGAFVSGAFALPRGYDGGMGANGTCLRTEAVTSGNRRLWAMEYDEQDQKLWFRRWHTSVGLCSGEGGETRVNVRISYYAKPGYIGRPGFVPFANVPKFVREMIDLRPYQCCVGETVLERCETYLTGDDFGRAFADSLTSSQRELPLILMCTDERGATPVWDAEEFAKKLAGMANVYVADWRDPELKDSLFSLFVRGEASFNYRCGPGTLRIYRPGVDLSDANSWRDNSPFFPKARIDEACGGDESRPEKFIEIIAKSLGRAISSDADDVVGIPDIGRAKTLENARKLGEQYRELKSRSVITTSAGQAPGEDEDVSSLKVELVEWQSIADVYSASYDEEVSRAEELRRKCSDLSNKASNLSYRLQEANARVDGLQEKNASLALSASVISSLEHIPTCLADELQLAERLWPSRIAVLPEAYASARGYPADLDEARRMLSAMANTLWKLHFSEESVDISGEFYLRTKFKHALSESGFTKTNGGLMRLRKRTYMGREIDISPHVKGKSGPRDEVFRIYYCPDAETRLLVIGHAGPHLPTSRTSKL